MQAEILHQILQKPNKVFCPNIGQNLQKTIGKNGKKHKNQWVYDKNVIKL